MTNHTDQTHAQRLLERIENRSARVAVVGLGYIGLPLADAVHGAGFTVIGFDTDAAKIEMLRDGRPYIAHLGPDLPARLAASPRFEPTSQTATLGSADVVVLCVPTPLDEHLEPDLSYVTSSAERLGDVLPPGRLVILESTTYPGTTRNELVSALTRPPRSRSRIVGEDLFIAYSPERENPGGIGHTTATIPKLVGGLDEKSLALASAFYQSFVKSVHAVASAEVAEAAKLLENIYRAVNIALVNELKIVLERMGIDVWEVVAAASTKPFGFHAFHPGPGLGGHCIPIDPYYLTWKAREVGYATRFIELAGEVNRAMPGHVVSRVAEALNDEAKPVRGSRLLVVGAAYKKNVGDVRETPAAEIITLLREKGAEVEYHDPHVPVFPPMRRYDIGLESVELSAQVLAAADCVLIVTDHDAVDWRLIADSASLVVDTRNVMARVDAIRARVVKA